MVRSFTDYVLRTDRRLFQDVAVRDLRHNSDHYMVLGCLRGDLEKELTYYLRKVCRFSLRKIRCRLASASDKLFSYLNTQIPKPPLHERVRRDWISDDMWAAMYARVTTLQEGGQWTVRQLSRRIRAGLSTDWKRQVEEADCTIESLLVSDPPLVRWAWVRMRGWYRYSANRPPPPACLSLENLTVELAEIYTHVPLPG